jgi:flagellar basal-body rod modification protein FlgD
MTAIAATINAATTGNPVTASMRAASASQSVNQADFLKLMTAQVAAQDPFDPMDQTAMLGQLAQFSQVAGTAEMNVSMGQLLETMRAQADLLADIRTALTPELTSPVPSAPTPIDTPPATGA